MCGRAELLIFDNFPRNIGLPIRGFCRFDQKMCIFANLMIVVASFIFTKILHDFDTFFSRSTREAEQNTALDTTP